MGVFCAEGTAGAKALQWYLLPSHHHRHPRSHLLESGSTERESVFPFYLLHWKVSFLKAGMGPYFLGDFDQHLAQSCPSVICVE